MVEYREWTAIAFDVARQKGLRTDAPGGQQTLAGGQSFAGDEPQNRLMAAVGTLWRAHEDDLRAANRAEARAMAGDLVKVDPDGHAIIGP